MKRLLFLFMVTLLFTACSNNESETEKPKEEETATLAEVKQDKVSEVESVEKASNEGEPVEVPSEAEELTTEEPEITEEKVKELIEYISIGDNDKLVSLSVENHEIKAIIYLEPTSRFPSEDLAASLYSDVAEELLMHEGWEVLTIEYMDIGTISMNRSEKETNEYGSYFPIAKIEELLGIEY